MFCAADAKLPQESVNRLGWIPFPELGFICGFKIETASGISNNRLMPGPSRRPHPWLEQTSVLPDPAGMAGKLRGLCRLRPRLAIVLGSGFQEVIFQRALEIEMASEGISASREFEMEIFYKGIKIGDRRVDFFVEEKIMVEIKALAQLEDVHLAQAINYLEAYGLQVGLLLNFGSRSLQFKRVMRPAVPAGAAAAPATLATIPSPRKHKS